uniref:Protein-tyrosine sulfotransferase n=1 Tax=Ascaris suum TaxID=6253 RepID=F1L7G4_ASCSU
MNFRYAGKVIRISPQVEQYMKGRMAFRSRVFLLCLLLSAFAFYVLLWPSTNTSLRYARSIVSLPKHYIGNVSSQSAFIFIGGVPRSGTTLMRAMLDAHPLIRCGEETRVIPRILGLRSQWKRNEKEWRRLNEAGVNEGVLDDAIASFIIQVIAGHGAPAERLCNKDPFSLKSTQYLAKLFPNSKFILMIRDGRATVNSIISRRVTITGFDLEDPRQCLQKWNNAITIMFEQCQSVGRSRCLMMYYEQLVLHPEKEMHRLLQFLDIPWNSSVLHHEQFIGKDISLSKVERSTDQVVKPVNLDALTKWVGKFPDDVIADMPQIAPMLAELGYDPLANPPNYGKPDDMVLKNTNDMHENSEHWYRKAVEVVADPERVDPPLPR